VKCFVTFRLKPEIHEMELADTVRVEVAVQYKTRAWQTVETVSYEEAFKRELVEFYECIAADREPRTTAADAVRDVALCQALVTAHLNGRGMALSAS